MREEHYAKDYGEIRERSLFITKLPHPFVLKKGVRLLNNLLITYLLLFR